MKQLRKRSTISPNQVTIEEVIEQAKRNLAWMERNYPRMVMEGRMSDWSARHKQAVQRETIRLLMNQVERKQPELFSNGSKIK